MSVEIQFQLQHHPTEHSSVCKVIIQIWLWAHKRHPLAWYQGYIIWELLMSILRKWWYQWLSERLWYLQCLCTGDTTVLHWAIDTTMQLNCIAYITTPFDLTLSAIWQAGIQDSAHHYRGPRNCKECQNCSHVCLRSENQEEYILVATSTNRAWGNWKLQWKKYRSKRYETRRLLISRHGNGPRKTLMLHFNNIATET